MMIYKCRPGARFRPCFFLAICLLAIFSLLLAQWALPARAAPLPAKTVKPTLCGRLVFLTEYKTGQQYLGLIPCGQSTPYIFHVRPRELYDYYRFADAVVADGPGVLTATYGRLTSYITKFKSYVPINNCNECNKAAGPTSTPESSQQALACSAWLLDNTEAAFPALSASGKLPEIDQKTTYYANGAVIRETCGLNATCMVQETARQVGLLLAPLLRQESVTTAQVIDFLGSLMTSSLTTAAAEGSECTQAADSAWSLAVGLNQQGYGIDIIASQGPAAPMARDAQGRQAGPRPGQAPLQDIPGSQVTVAISTTFLLLPTDPGLAVSLLGNGFGALNLTGLQNTADKVHLMTFDGVLVTGSTHGELMPPALMIDAHGSGSLQARQPDHYAVYPLLVERLGWPTQAPEATLQATEALTTTATVLPTSPTSTLATAAPTPGPPTPAPTPQTSRSPFSFCPLSAGMVGICVWGYMKRRRQPTKDSSL